MRMIAILVFVAVAGCATSPEGKLKQGYDTSSRVITTATILVDRDQLRPNDAENVLRAGVVSKDILDAAKANLAQCRATTVKTPLKDPCAGIAANIDLGSGLLLELEKYLETQD